MKRGRGSRGAVFFMAGTERTGKYKVPVVTSLGKVGYRNIEGGRCRIRIEPANKVAAAAMAANFPPTWKKGYGGAEFRFSLVVEKDCRARAIAAGLKAIGAIPGEAGVRVSSRAPKFVRELMTQVRA